MDQSFPGIPMGSRRYKDLKGSESETREPESDRLSQPSVDDSLSLPGLAGRLEQEDVESRFSQEPAQLVDLAPEEAKRRGNELLSLLSEGDKAPDLPNLPPQPSLAQAGWSRKPLDAFEMNTGKGAACGAQGPWTKKVEMTSWDAPPGLERSGYARSESEAPYPWGMSQNWMKELTSPAQPCSAALPQPAAPYFSEDRLRSELVPLLLEAAHRAFGRGQTATVRLMADYTGYEVLLQGSAAEQLLTREEMLLEALGQELEPFLGEPYVDMNRSLDQTTTPGSVPSWRLILWRSSEGEAADARRCWAYVRHGTCPRGKACRWEHEIPQSIGIGIKVSAVR